MLSEILNIPSVSAVSGLNITNNEVSVNREIDGGKEVVNIQTILHYKQQVLRLKYHNTLL